MIDTLLSAEYLAPEGSKTHILQKKQKRESNTSLWLLSAMQPENTALTEVVWNTFEKEYFGNIAQIDDPYECFEEALRTVNNALSHDESVTTEEFYRSNTLLLALFVDGALHISVVGNGEVYLVRKGKVIVISEGLSPQKFGGEVFANIASGDLEKDDRIILTSERLLRYATPNQLTEMVSRDVEGAAEEIAELLRMADVQESFVVLASGSTKEPLPLEDSSSQKAPASFLQKSKESFSLSYLQATIVRFWRKLQSGEQKQFLGVVLGVLGLVLCIVLFLSFSDRSDEQEYEEYKQLLSQVDNSIKNVEDLETLGETETANANLAKIERDLDTILQSSYFRSEATVFAQELSQIRDRINNITRISTPKELANLKTRKNEVSAKGVVSYGDEWFAFDSTTLFRIVLEGVENVIPLLSEIAISDGVPLEQQQKIIFMDQDAKLVEYDVTTESPSLAKTTDETWKNAVAMSSYGDNVYLLSPEEKQIWKYEYQLDSFSAAIPYLQEDYADMSDAVSVTIDGNVFALTSTGKLLKFFKGILEEYEVTGAPTDIWEGATQIYTNEQLDNILILNPKKSTVYIFFKGSKQAQYLSQIVFENVGTLQKIWAEAPQKLVVVDETKVYSAEF